MLVLTRKVGETILIGDDIFVTVAAIHGESVRIGVAAPRSVQVDREEIHDRRCLEYLREEVVQDGTAYAVDLSTRKSIRKGVQP